MIAITGSTGQLGRLVISDLLTRVPADQIVAIARDPESAATLGVSVREGDYDRPETLATAFEGVDRLLLISASEIGKRVPQHRAVIDAAKASGVGLIVYTSLLHADTSALGLAEEHRQTEAYLAESGVPYTVLRNGWYIENYTGSIGAAVEHGAVLGSAGDARLTPATRADYAAAAAAVLTADDPAGEVYELAGDEAFTMAEYAAEVARQSGREVAYRNMPEADYRGALEGMGLPAPVAAMIAQSDAAASEGALYDDSHTLSRLIGRPTTPLAQAIAAALAD
ncbi:SDR family oxidoreductase [Rubricoccus marinus]|uniref:NAD(P)-dependent oxidoreductase n=1 Tax=Rubricoccus marinus TaxID=716817 RepID=A0A259TV37_9BACT|nr:SDR family oxidoreductase [Rubricoccus marinus]OZC01560.1 NAD(P)-dependent oxidoreductase [Rubricoccus marinus]